MKFSIIIGVFQMLVGIANKCLNALYFRDKRSLFLEGIPQFLLMFCSFGYMSILIVAKWLTDFRGRESSAPSIIGFFLGFPSLNKNALLGRDEQQQRIQLVLLVIMLISIPIMLLGKPLMFHFFDSKKQT